MRDAHEARRQALQALLPAANFAATLMINIDVFAGSAVVPAYCTFYISEVVS